MIGLKQGIPSGREHVGSLGCVLKLFMNRDKGQRSGIVTRLLEDSEEILMEDESRP